VVELCALAQLGARGLGGLEVDGGGLDLGWSVSTILSRGVGLVGLRVVQVAGLGGVEANEVGGALLGAERLEGVEVVGGAGDAGVLLLEVLLVLLVGGLGVLDVGLLI